MVEIDAFEAQRPRLFSIAYRMLGSASEAEDVLQDAWLRLSGAETADIRSPQAFMTTIVTRLCLDRLKSAHAKREEYIGPWLPEPVITRGGEAPDAMAERSESVTLAFLVLLEALSPEERAVFLLKEVFEYEHAEIAEMLGTTPANSRQLFHRAKAKIRPARPRAGSGENSDTRRTTAARFARAFQSGDGSELARLLAADVSFVADGGGKAAAARRPLKGREQVAAFLLGIHRSAIASGLAAKASIELTEVNSEPALVLRVGGDLDGVFVLNVEHGAIRAIHVVRNPEKLGYLRRQLDTTH
jgi:RNA polymerase sigma-70 factor (ECF subfamily)